MVNPRPTISASCGGFNFANGKAAATTNQQFGLKFFAEILDETDKYQGTNNIENQSKTKKAPATEFNSASDVQKPQFKKTLGNRSRSTLIQSKPMALHEIQNAIQSPLDTPTLMKRFQQPAASSTPIVHSERNTTNPLRGKRLFSLNHNVEVNKHIEHIFEHDDL